MARIQISGGTADGQLRDDQRRGARDRRRARVLSVAGAATLTVQGAGNALTLAGELRAQSVALAAAGDITQTADGVLVFRDAGPAPPRFATACRSRSPSTGAGTSIALAGDNGRLRVTSATTSGWRHRDPRPRPRDRRHRHRRRRRRRHLHRLQ